MRKQLATLLAALAIMFSLAGGRSAMALEIYVLTGTESGSGNQAVGFGKIDSTTGIYTEISANVGAGNQVSNLSWNAAAANFFVTENVGANQTLRTLDTSGVLSSSIGTIGRTVYGMAYRTSDSRLYAYDYSREETGWVNPSNGQWTQLNLSPGVAGSSPTGGRYSIMNGIMYFAGNFGVDGIGTMGFTSSSTYQQILANNLYSNMVLANDGTTMYGVYGNVFDSQQKLYTINVATGALTAGPTVSGTGLGTRFYGAGIVPVPEPSSYILATIATGVMAFAARRRKARRA